MTTSRHGPDTERSGTQDPSGLSAPAVGDESGNRAQGDDGTGHVPAHRPPTLNTVPVERLRAVRPQTPGRADAAAGDEDHIAARARHGRHEQPINGTAGESAGRNEQAGPNEQAGQQDQPGRHEHAARRGQPDLSASWGHAEASRSTAEVHSPEHAGAEYPTSEHPTSEQPVSEHPTSEHAGDDHGDSGHADTGHENPQQSPPTASGVRVLAKRYHLIAPIGRGTGGVVWEGYDLAAHRKVALKQINLRPDMPERELEVARERAQREARAIAALAHPNVVAFYDLLDVGGTPWVVMEMLQARSLADLIRSEGPLAPQRVATIGLAVLSGLEAAHRAGIMHRDVKPGNIMLTDGGRVKLTDFGIARSDGDSTLTESGTLVGSPSYIPPEVLQGAAPTPAVDLWGLGASLYAAVEARAPFDAGDPMSTLQSVVSDPTPVPERAGALGPVIAGLMAKDPRRRLGTVQARHLLLDAARSYDRESMADAHRQAAGLTPDPDATVVMSRVVNGQAPPPETVAETRTVTPPAPESASVPEQAADPTPAAELHRPPPLGVGAFGAVDLGDEDTASLPLPAAEPRRPEPPQPVRTTDDRDHRSGTRTVAAMLVALLFIGTFGYGCYYVITKVTGHGKSPAAAGSQANSPASKPTAPSQSASQSSAPTKATGNYVAYQDPAGFSVQVPKGWTKTPQSSGVTDFDDPSADRFVRLVHGLTPPGNLVAAFQSAEQQFASDHAGYHRIALTGVTFRGYPAADWEFTYTTTDGVQRHVRYRQFVVNGTTYGIYISAPEDQFAASVPMFTQAADTFTVR